MAKVTKMLDAMSKQDREIYLIASNCSQEEINPFNPITEIRNHQAWSAGHLDRWGRV